MGMSRGRASAAGIDPLTRERMTNAKHEALIVSSASTALGTAFKGSTPLTAAAT